MLGKLLSLGGSVEGGGGESTPCDLHLQAAGNVLCVESVELLLLGAQSRSRQVLPNVPGTDLVAEVDGETFSAGQDPRLKVCPFAVDRVGKRTTVGEISERASEFGGCRQ